MTAEDYGATQRRGQQRFRWLLGATLVPTLAAFTWVGGSQLEAAGCGSSDAALVPSLLASAACVDVRLWPSLAALVIASVFFATLSRDWNGGPPDWARESSAFAIGACGFILAVGAWALIFGFGGMLLLWGVDLRVLLTPADLPNFELSGPLEVMLLLLYWIGLVMGGAIYIGFVVHERASSAGRQFIDRHALAAGPLSVVGSAVGATLGAVITAALFALVAYAILLYAVLSVVAYVIVGFLVFGVAASRQ